jgi:signal transduction histidine kinase
VPEALKPAEVFAFEEERRERSVIPVRAACLLGIGAFVAFAFVDPYLIANARPLLVARGIIVLTIAVVLAVSFTRAGVQSIALLAILACLAIGGGVIVVTVLSGGAVSRYHEALLLTFLGFAVLVPWPPVTASITFGALVALYDGALLFWKCASPTGLWVSNNFVLWSGVAIATVGVTVANNLRSGDFWNRARLKEAAEDLKAVDKAKSRFFANLSHELRTPLTMIYAPLEALLEEGSETSEAQREQLELSRRNVVRLLRVVDDLLELSRLESDSLRLRTGPVDLGRLAADLGERAEPLARRKRIAVRVDAEVGAALIVQGDETQLERVLLNLITNALKFTEEGGSIRVRVEERGEGVRVAVIDTGIGIPSDQIGRIFDRFYQVEGSRTRRAGGTGIGLALAREVVELHGGKIEAESEVGKGTTIAVWLPRALMVPPHAIEKRRQEVVVQRDRRAPATGLPEWHDAIRSRDEYRLLPLADATERRLSPRPRTGATPRGERPLVLVVEDNPDMAQLLMALLSTEYEVVLAVDGEQGALQARKRIPTVIVSDLMMPKMDGFGLIRAVRADPKTARTPVILLTAHGQNETRLEATEGGADAYLTKPFLPRELRATLANLIRKDESFVHEAREDRETALRVLAEGFAHEILNPLGFVQSALIALREIALAAVGAMGEAAARECEDVEDMSAAGREGIDRVRAIVEQLRKFSRGGAGDTPVPHRVGEIFASLNRLLRARTFDLRLTISDKTTRVALLRPGVMEQVLLNLAKNAYDAAGPGCELELKAWDREEGGIEIAISDNGPGIPAEHIEKIFYPFFTTKDPGKGTGLGLALVRQMIKEHGGSLTVANNRDRGATFTIVLPEAEPEAATALAN